MTTDCLISEEELNQAVEIIRNGGVVAFPTETYYGLAVDPFNDQALSRLFKLKKRAAEKPILVLVSSLEQLTLLARQVPPLFQPLVEEFWPGPLTLVLAGVDLLSSLLTGNTGTVGVRMSSCPVAHRLAARAGMPITATSANLSGQAPAVDCRAVQRQFGDQVDFILDGGSTPGGLGSTVVDLTGERPRLIRPGVVPYEKVLEVSREKS